MLAPVLFTAGLLMAMTPGLPVDKPALAGEWGGPQVRLVLTETGGQLDLGCAAAAFGAPVRPDAVGQFTASARYEAFDGGPTLADVPPKLQTVRVTGHVDGDTLHLAIDHGHGAAPEAHTLQRGRRVKIIRCN